MDTEDANVNSFLQQIQAETQRAKFAEQVQALSDRCWDVCFTDTRPPSKLDGKTQNCITNCVNRMIDASAFMMLFTYSNGNSLFNVVQQLLNLRFYRPKNTKNSTIKNQSNDKAHLLRVYREVFSSLDKESLQKVFKMVQCRGFRTRTSNLGFNKRLLVADQPQSVFDFFAKMNKRFNLNNEKRVRDELDQYNSYKLEFEKLSENQQKPFTDGFVKGILSKSQTDKPGVPKKGVLIRNILWLIFFLIVLNYLTGFVKIRVGDKQLGSILFSSPQEVRPEDVSVTFDDVRGMDEAKHEVQEIVNYLRAPDSFSRLGGRLPKGVLLVGSPGTGKTLLARAIAGEAQVPFFHTSGSEFDEVLVGQGARRVRDLFERAKEKAPCIVFIDEIDSVGSKRISNGVHPYANQTINQLLSEMDGFERNEGVIVIGATNRVEDLDNALLRPGRFDVRVSVLKPDLANRKDIFNLYLDKIIHDKSVNEEVLAKGTPGFTGADIENMVNQAALKAATEGCKRVGMRHLDEAKDRVLMGPARLRGKFPDEDMNKMTAYHEAGHTLIAIYTKHAVPLHKVTIIPRGSSLGHTSLLPEKDSVQVTRAQMLAQMDVMMGGRVAEELIFGDENVTTGAGNDLKQATELALSMVKEHGMSDKVGLRDFTVTENHNSLVSMNEMSTQVHDTVDQEVGRLLNESYIRAKEILTKHKKEHKLLAEALIEYETLTADEVHQVVKGEKIARLITQPAQPSPRSPSSKISRHNPSDSVRTTFVQIEVD